MEIKIELLNVTKYERKEDKTPRTLINYRVYDKDVKQVSSDKFKGYPILTAYFDGHDVFNKIPADICGTCCTATIKKETSAYDPLKEFSKIVKINDISLV